jgi:hypothetical protein
MENFNNQYTFHNICKNQVVEVLVGRRHTEQDFNQH